MHQSVLGILVLLLAPSEESSSTKGRAGVDGSLFSWGLSTVSTLLGPAIQVTQNLQARLLL